MCVLHMKAVLSYPSTYRYTRERLAAYVMRVDSNPSFFGGEGPNNDGTPVKVDPMKV